ncbi:hypothetical protein QBC34DRAFT_57388 [Podospora aff. communis PSN243]|uniref:3-beta hydroxysteroid dehydrogenase/isomerase domain-containing protein n=1 Tax=Podospora aff. communis PSN243 TaxID=3040156 RepID=A0AAV9GVV5_9PEZI|nr:hypothetical protein QBC34DRAFT_57388 [Podospora aff. communis PSN243]
MSLEIVISSPLLSTAVIIAALVIVYLARLNEILRGTPDDVKKLSPSRWSESVPLLRETYRRLEAEPITTNSYAQRIPPKLERRYIVTGGSGLVGGYIVLQLLERGQSPESIRVIDFRAPSREDMGRGPASRVDFAQADISSAESTERAFSKPWGLKLRKLPLTVFHTAAVIVPSDRSKLEYAFCEAVNVQGTQHIVDAAKRAGADILVSTTSASISIRPVELWVAPWNIASSSDSRWPRNYHQVLDEQDFWLPLRRHEEYYANYPASKAAAERIVCGANSESLRTGCIRPANGVYGNPTDNTVGGPLNSGTYPTWTSHIVQSFVHGINAAIAHLDFEAILTSPRSSRLPQAGRPFVVTDPNPPITYSDLYFLIKTLAVTPFRTIPLPLVPMILLSYVIEGYSLLRLKWPILFRVLPPISGDIKHLKPALFTICTHLVASNDTASRPVKLGGLGFTGVLTTLEGMTQEVVEWNRVHQAVGTKDVTYRSSVSLAEEIQKATRAGSSGLNEETKYAMMR